MESKTACAGAGHLLNLKVVAHDQQDVEISRGGLETSLRNGTGTPPKDDLRAFLRSNRLL